MEIITRFFKTIPKSYFLFGPRGTGKSTLIKELYPGAVTLDLLLPDVYRELSAFPERLGEIVKAYSPGQVFIIDEVQKAPGLLSVVHHLIEMKHEWQFILTGSSARKLKKEGVDLLGGRAQLKHLHPFMAAEIKGYFNLENNIKLGMLPLILGSNDPAQDLKTYIALYMQQEVQMEGIVRNIESFGRFLEAMSFSQASVINCANIARDCYVSNKTVENYIQILEDLLLSFKIPIFTKRAKRTLTSHPKFYYFDVGVFQSLRPRGPLEDTAAINGLALETLVAQHLRAYLDYSSQKGNLYFWRTRTGVEVDFIIYGEIGFYAIEVKNSTLIKSQDLQGLQLFKQDYPECQCIFLSHASPRMKKADIMCLPITEFLLSLIPGEALCPN